MNALRLLRMMRLMMMLVTVLSPRASSSSSVEANATRVHLSMPVTQADASVYLAARSSRSLLLVLPRCVQLLLPNANGTGSYSLRVAVTRSSASNVPEPDISHPEVIPGYQRRVSNGSATNATTYVVAALPLPGCVLRPEDWLLPVRASAINASREFQNGDVLGSDVVGVLTPEQMAAFTNLSRELGLGSDTVAAFFGAVNATANLTAASILAEVAKRLGLTSEQVKALSAGAGGGGGVGATASERSSRRERALTERADGRQTVRDWPTPQVTSAPSSTRAAVSFSATTTTAGRRRRRRHHHHHGGPRYLGRIDATEAREPRRAAGQPRGAAGRPPEAGGHRRRKLDQRARRAAVGQNVCDVELAEGFERRRRWRRWRGCRGRGAAAERHGGVDALGSRPRRLGPRRRSSPHVHRGTDGDADADSRDRR
ncbi:uncharacterized protein LOC144741326 [Lampetra planeri]